MAADLKVPAQFDPKVAAPKAVSAQHFVEATGGDKGANLLGKSPDIVGGGHHRPRVALQLLRHKWHPWRLGWVQQSITLASLTVTRQFGQAGTAPYIRLPRNDYEMGRNFGQNLVKNFSSAKKIHINQSLNRDVNDF